MARAFALLLFLGLGLAQTTPVWGFRVVNTYPHDPAAFTQGLVYHQGVLYEGTGLYGQSSLRRVELKTGRVLQSHRLGAEYFGEGVTLFQNRLYQLTWRNRVGFIYDLSLRPIGRFSYDTEGWGLTHDGRSLIMSDGSARLYFLNPRTLRPERTLIVRADGVPVERLNELEYIQGRIWANVWLTTRIAIIHPQSGVVEAWLELGPLALLAQARNPNPDAVLNGIAYDEQNRRIYVTGKLWPYLFEIEPLRK
ncbi:MAG: glutaminyl-peptide cyclotransferase [Meiothermus sp.]|uniref:glutaminyl-peptide cyclotransferase n=1 Tax=Meiothermus sp. TaxID=1955249 RepID=UPI0025E157D6|nr:glutaminyl-peptide cyclotransferase [Meiothermus sp.]MCS7193770.1 glutaminyl-peptide cyclotransferase [Meiothermus sp.]MCX7739653.1 glutaminyl-peptide cyclotransferase [Meiothermus sp.]MDW8091638.1 glutaminyl-peptide cyclotransferase [Meiothermus sp.]